jgi:hypothetical protein
MADAVVQKVEADASKVVADAKADVSKVETAVVTDWKTKVWPWLTHAGTLVLGYFASYSGVVSALIKKL